MNAREFDSELAAARLREDWVRAVTRWFAAHELCYGHGTDCAEDEAWWLVWQLSGTPEQLETLPADPALVPQIAALARQRVEQRLPLAYLLGRAWFAGLEFEVGPAVLIPRSPLAELLEQRFAPWVTLEPGDRVLEIGTGSGCIAVAAAVHQPDLAIDATEIDPAALALAERNVARHAAGDRVRLLRADLFPPDALRYRVIMSNPPYVPTTAIAELPPEYGHEPPAALDGGPDGLAVVRRLLAGARQRLDANGVLIVEVGLAAEALTEAFPHVPWTWIEFERGGDGVFVLTAEELSDGCR
jgi:ribosomal protein L3 glutamine methyltransferase